MTLRLAFMGTPDFAARSLAEIAAAGHEVARVYTQPPRRRGRGQAEQKTPVHQLAEVLGIPVSTPESFRDPQVIEEFASLDLDVAAVVAYGQILPQAALDAPEHSDPDAAVELLDALVLGALQPLAQQPLLAQHLALDAGEQGEAE